MYYNTTDDTVYVYDGTSWLDLAAGGGGTGDITAVVAGDGLTGGALSGTATLSVGAGTGISVAGPAVSIDSSVVATLSGTQTISNKTITAPIISSAGAAFVGSTSGTVTVKGPAVAGSGTLTFGTATGTILSDVSVLPAENLSGAIPGSVTGKAKVTVGTANPGTVGNNSGDIWIDSDDITTYTAGIPVTAFDARGDILVGTGNDTYSTLATGTAGQILRALGTAGAAPYYEWINKVNVNTYTTAGTHTWTKPAGVTRVFVMVVGGGGGGGSGARINESASAIYSGGGGGGGGGGVVQAWIDAAALTSTVTVTVGGGGPGGAAIAATAALTAGNAGGNGTASTFGSYMTALGGSGGKNGIITSGTASGTLSAPGAGNGYALTGAPSFTTTAPGPSVTTITLGSAIANAGPGASWGGWGVQGVSSGQLPDSGFYSLDNPIGPAGGASGGGKSNAGGTAMKGGNGGRGFGLTLDAPAAGGAAFGSGVVGGTAGAAGTIGFGNGGAGGASGGSANGGPGGAGSFGGGGGGGGGAAIGTTIATVSGGAGGAGGAGLVFVMAI